MSSELIAILEKEASAEIERVLADARVQADHLITEARKEAQAYLEAQRQHLDAERKAARAKALSAAQVRASALVLQTKDRAASEVFAKADAELAGIQQDKAKYPAVLRGLIREAANGLGNRVVIEVRPRDLDLTRHAVRELKLDAEVKPSEEVSGGARATTGDGRLVVENTLTSRVERVKPLLISEVAALLWG